MDTFAYWIVLVALAMAPAPAFTADAGNGSDFDQIAAGVFFQELYTFGGWTLFCGERFGSDWTTAAGEPVVIIHIYPVLQMLRRAGCDSRMACREQDNGLFRSMEADMHNMYPVRQTLVNHLTDREYGEIPAEDQRFDDCDIEWKAGVVEPRDIIRGNIARSMLYMQQRYGVPLDEPALEMFRTWNRTDPPSDQEKMRNNRIEQLQGNRNPFIDHPGMAGQRSGSGRR